jgi:hypothetical protein
MFAIVTHGLFKTCSIKEANDFKHRTDGKLEEDAK